MNVGAILKNKGNRVVTAAPTDSITKVAAILARERIGAVLIVGAEGDIVGVLSERDIVRGIADRGEQCLALEAQALMTHEVVTCAPTDSVAQIMGTLTDRRVRHLPVLDEGRLVGLISIGDVVKHRLADTEKEAAALREYIVGG